jgi:hypothetical protein
VSRQISRVHRRTAAFHPVIYVRQEPISQEVVGRAFGVVDVPYGILLAFVVFAV